MKENETKTSNNMYPTAWQAFLGIIICFLIVVIGAGWSHRQHAAVLGDSVVVSESETAETLEADIPAREITPAVNVPEWQRLVATAEAEILGDNLYFTLDGEPVDSVITGEEYYQVDRVKYENFVPKSVDDLILLQLPEETLRPLSERSTFVVLAAPWKVPADVSGELVYQVDSWDGYDITPGEYVSGPVTVWMLPWSQRAGLASKE